MDVAGHRISRNVIRHITRVRLYKIPNVGEELADVAIYLLGLSEILGVDLENEIVKKVDKNEKREYQRRDGVITRTKEV